MKSLSLSDKLLLCASALALLLLAGPVTSSALQLAKPATTAPATTKPGLNTLTPTAPVPSSNGASSVGDIRDIRQPRHLPTIPPWAAVAVGVVLFGALAFARQRWGRRGKFLQRLPHEIALQSLEEARRLMNPERAREYCFAASNIIRRYVEDRFHVHAPRLTTEEFLRDLVEVSDMMLESQRALLGQFLEHCDLAKFASWHYSMPDLESMHATARSFVHQTAVAAVPVPTAKAYCKMPSSASSSSSFSSSTS